MQDQLLRITDPYLSENPKELLGRAHYIWMYHPMSNLTRSKHPRGMTTLDRTTTISIKQPSLPLSITAISNLSWTQTQMSQVTDEVTIGPQEQVPQHAGIANLILLTSR